MTQSTLVESDQPTLLPCPNRGDPERRKKPWLRPTAITLTIIVAGVALIAWGTSWTLRTGTIENVATMASVAQATATSSEVEFDDAEVEATVTETTASVDPESTAVVAVAGEITTLDDVSAIAAGVVDSVVTVNVTIDVRGPGDLTGTGSGIILDTDGTVVTNAHVVSDATSVTVTLTDGSTVAATVIGVDESNDVAVLTVNASGLSPISIGSASELAVGNPLIAVGNPLGLEGGPSVTTGIVSALGRVLEDTSVSLTGVIQTDAAITEGSSGGALLDAQGRLVGMTTAVGVSSVGVEGIGFAIPVETVMTVAAQLTSG